jgi:hypothetical protein
VIVCPADTAKPYGELPKQQAPPGPTPPLPIIVSAFPTLVTTTLNSAAKPRTIAFITKLSQSDHDRLDKRY